MANISDSKKKISEDTKVYIVEQLIEPSYKSDIKKLIKEYTNIYEYNTKYIDELIQCFNINCDNNGKLFIKECINMCMNISNVLQDKQIKNEFTKIQRITLKHAKEAYAKIL